MSKVCQAISHSGYAIATPSSSVSTSPRLHILTRAWYQSGVTLDILQVHVPARLICVSVSPHSVSIFPVLTGRGSFL